MTDAAHNQHSETRRPSDRDRIVTTPADSNPPVQKYWAEMMSVSVRRSRKIVVGQLWLGEWWKRERNCPLSGTRSVCLGRNQAARRPVPIHEGAPRKEIGLAVPSLAEGDEFRVRPAAKSRIRRQERH